MSTPRVVVCNVAFGSWYPAGTARMIRAFELHPNKPEIQAWVNVRPPGAPSRALIESLKLCDGAEVWSEGYCAKVFAVDYAVNSGADIVLLVDSSIFPINDITPLTAYIAANGLYAAPDGFTFGQWCNDATLALSGYTRDVALTLPGLSSACVGFDVRRPEIRELLTQWRENWKLILGPHGNSNALDKRFRGRSVGPCSNDPRCLGHRHDQSTLAALIYRNKLSHIGTTPNFWAYELWAEGWPPHFRRNAYTLLMNDGRVK